MFGITVDLQDIGVEAADGHDPAALLQTPCEFSAGLYVSEFIIRIGERDAEGRIIGTVDRETTLRVQTPQIFRAELIKGALTKAVEKGIKLTDDCAAAEMMGVRTKTVLGDEDNIKITTPRDMLFAAEILKERGDYL